MNQTQVSMKDRIAEMLGVGNLPKDIASYVGCDISYVYQVRKQLNGGKSTRKYARTTKELSNGYEGPEGLKLLLDEYDKACKTIDKVMDFLLKENSDLKEQVKQFNRITREANRPSWSPAVRNALVVHGD